MISTLIHARSEPFTISAADPSVPKSGNNRNGNDQSLRSSRNERAILDMTDEI